MKYISNMTIQDAIRQRHSVRSYSDRPVEKEKLKALQALVDEYNQQSGLHIQLVTNDPTAFDSRMAHYGKFSGISNYLAMIGPKSDELLDEKIGYYGERLVLEAQMMGLNSCWVGLTFKKNPDVLRIADGEKLRCVISLGYGETEGA
ncbi:MAG: nitroreductase family protein, partial [Candidatus Cryptobacteroides sp.]|nr:nitroreductase family protein [Candidatus Cryptobacteroides sp.]